MVSHECGDVSVLYISSFTLALLHLEEIFVLQRQFWKNGIILPVNVRREDQYQSHASVLKVPCRVFLYTNKFCLHSFCFQGSSTLNIFEIKDIFFMFFVLKKNNT